MRRRAAALVALAILPGAPAGAQQPAAADRPGPYVIDLRGVTAGLPDAPLFYPPATASVTIPARGFGADVGAHVYLFSLGVARVGVGANYVTLRGTGSSEPPPSTGTMPATGTTTPSTGATTGGTSSGTAATTGPTDVAVRVSTIAPQVSFNFGTSRGWSYLSAGLGTAQVRTTVSRTATRAERDSGRVNSVNIGGGARWFMKRRLAVGFDIRVHRLSPGKPQGMMTGTPRAQVVTIAVGVSVK